jgi:hypothetical protein
MGFFFGDDMEFVLDDTVKLYSDYLCIYCISKADIVYILYIIAIFPCFFRDYRERPTPTCDDHQACQTRRSVCSRKRKEISRRGKILTKILVRHFGISIFFLPAKRIDRVSAPRLRGYRGIRLDLQPLDRCGRMSEQRYQRLVMIGFRKDGSAQCSPKFAVSFRRSPMIH